MTAGKMNSPEKIQLLRYMAAFATLLVTALIYSGCTEQQSGTNQQQATQQTASPTPTPEPASPGGIKGINDTPIIITGGSITLDLKSRDYVLNGNKYTSTKKNQMTAMAIYDLKSRTPDDPIKVIDLAKLKKLKKIKLLYLDLGPSIRRRVTIENSTDCLSAEITQCINLYFSRVSDFEMQTTGSDIKLYNGVHKVIGDVEIVDKDDIPVDYGTLPGGGDRKFKVQIGGLP